MSVLSSHVMSCPTSCRRRGLPLIAVASSPAGSVSLIITGVVVAFTPASPTLVAVTMIVAFPSGVRNVGAAREDSSPPRPRERGARARQRAASERRRRAALQLASRVRVALFGAAHRSAALLAHEADRFAALLLASRLVIALARPALRTRRACASVLSLRQLLSAAASFCALVGRLRVYSWSCEEATSCWAGLPAPENVEARGRRRSSAAARPGGLQPSPVQTGGGGGLAGRHGCVSDGAAHPRVIDVEAVVGVLRDELRGGQEERVVAVFAGVQERRFVLGGARGDQRHTTRLAGRSCLRRRARTHRRSRRPPACGCR